MELAAQINQVDISISLLGTGGVGSGPAQSHSTKQTREIPVRMAASDEQSKSRLPIYLYTPSQAHRPTRFLQAPTR